MLLPPLLKIGLISDTHLPYRLHMLPPLIQNIFQDVDLILHAGDVDDIEYLHPLMDLAPIYAVRGNFHIGDVSWAGKHLPNVVQLRLASYNVILTHGHRTGLIGLLTKVPEIFLANILQFNYGLTLNQQIARRLHRTYPDADIVIFGHTHVAYQERIGKTLFLNPGSTVFDGFRTRCVGILELWPNRMAAHFIPLDHIAARQADLHRWISPTEPS